ncbi:MAG: ABC transporter ATP-binding protein [Gemmataceae bacterium]|nr:ABC transporter ATP-binding protein [Gemmataceae bacterium]MDW8265151.1 ABC transporter ATP-binding protein [Gemmataceae bacterium]
MPSLAELNIATTVTVESDIVLSARVLQVAGLFDLKPTATTRLSWQVRLPLHEQPWHIGLIVGPSGCGKSTIARHVFGPGPALPPWPDERSILDAFPAGMSIKEIVALLSSVGFASPPAWLRPFRVLSTGQQFRASLARLLAHAPDLAVMDEFTSTVDRTVAQVGSAALARTVRQRGQRFVAVTCHEDVTDWLQPDWVYAPATGTFTWRRLQRRPAIPLRVVRCRRQAWELFRAHHYLSHDLAPGAVCFLATWREQPVAFSAWVNHLTRGGGKREHRTVTLPDFQGVGIGMALSDYCASLWKGLGYRATSTTSHPAFVAARRRSPHWRMLRPASLAAGRERSGVRHATTRLTAGFEYVGPALPRLEAGRVLGREVDRPTARGRR